MVTFLFWNLKKKPLEQFVANLAKLHEVDVIMLIESELDPGVLLRVLNDSNGSQYHYSSKSLCRKVQIFTKFSDNFIKPIEEDDRLTIRQLELPGLTKILLAVTHFPSKFNWDSDEQASYCPILVRSISGAESKAGHNRTVLVGDLNMSPFETGVIGAFGLHAVMSRRIAGKRKRIVQKTESQFFYNPMWRLFGNATRGPMGTYYRYSSKPNEYFWYIFDQVLVRPDLLDRFNDDDLELLTSDGTTSFISFDGIPDVNIASDHLPILFKLML
ncbi:MAG: endonuclease/exonuclease/phosphatase family protein [Methanothrix sp.]